MSVSDDLVTVTINGRQVSVPKGTLLVEAAKQAGIDIPVFCYHPKLKPVGACRMCLVEIEKMPRLQTACTTPVADGMVVQSTSPNAIAAQNGVIELILANHPLDCPICDKGGECPLQDNTFRYGLGASRMGEEKRHKDKAFPLSELIALDRERCIMCFRCVRFQDEIPGDAALAVIDRGAGSEIGCLPGESFDSPFSGNTIEICPVGALTSRQYRFRARPWDLRRTPSVCGGCAVGCNVELHARDGHLLRMIARENPEVDDGWLCDRGRFETLPPMESNRPLRPHLRGNADLSAVSWEEALSSVAARLRATKSAVLARPGLSNEALRVLAGPLRRALPDSGFGFAPSIPALPPPTGSIAALPACGRILVAGLDPWSELPVLALWLRKATQRGAALVVVGPSNGLRRDSSVWLNVSDEQTPDALEQLANAIEQGAEGDLGRAAELLKGEAPAAFLFGPRLARLSRAAPTLERLRRLLDVQASGALSGCLPLDPNGRGALELAPELVAADPLASDPELVLYLGPAATAPAAGRLLLATSGAYEPDERVEALLPLAHLYEQAGSLTNLEGRVQRLEAGGFVGQSVLPDWALLARLANVLGENVPTDLDALRAALVDEQPLVPANA